MPLIEKLLQDESGATAVEYALVVGLISFAIIGTLSVMGTTVDSILTRVNNSLSSPTNGSGG